MKQYYGKDLAYIHDDGFGGFARQASKDILSLLRDRGIEKGLVVDLGCGSGIWAHILHENGYQPHGIDISSSMIALAKQRTPEGHFEVNSYLTADLPSCSAVTSLGECFNYLFDENHSSEQLKQLFERVFTALEPNGLFIFDVAGLDYARATAPLKRHFIGEDWAVLIHVAEHKREHLITRYITYFRKTETGLYRRDEEAHRVRLLSGSELARTLRSVGFKVRLRKGYGSLKLSSAHHVLIARKP